jgi:hypothetical protein
MIHSYVTKWAGIDEGVPSISLRNQDLLLKVERFRDLAVYVRFMG